MSIYTQSFAPICVQTQMGAYAIHLSSPLDQSVRLMTDFVAQRKIVVISHPKIADCYYLSLKKAMQQAGAINVDLYQVPEGETHKTLNQAEKIWTYCLENKYRRDLLLVALGGGMVGDLTGFVASCYMRGVDFIQCPTTLLAQIDAAIGGKTAINHVLGKNLIGTFFAPKAVWIDPLYLKSLPKRDFISGLAELIKYGMILDATFFEWLEQNIITLWEHPEKWPYAIYKACQFKAQVVGSDEFESYNRMILNFGHTIGHAIENIMDYQNIRHGEAVAIGMVVATHLSCKVSGLPYTILTRLVTLLKALGLPYTLPDTISVDQILNVIKLDKKFFNALHWVLLSKLGEAVITTDVRTETVRSILHQMHVVQK